MQTPQRCDRVQEWISLDLDGELSRFERVLVKRHLLVCAECASFSADLRGFTAALRAAPLEQLERPIALPSRRRLVPLRSVQVAAAALAVAAVGIGSLASSLGEERLGARITPAQAVPVDEGVDLLRARQLRELEERIAQTMPRPVGTQPV